MTVDAAEAEEAGGGAGRLRRASVRARVGGKQVAQRIREALASSSKHN